MLPTLPEKPTRSRSPVHTARLWLAGIGTGVLALFLAVPKPWSVRVPPDEKWRTEDYFAAWFGPALGLALFVILLMAWLAPFWAVAVRSVPALPLAGDTPRWFWPLTLGALVATAVFCHPMMAQSAWHDEANRIKNTTVGRFKIEGDGTAKYRGVKWVETFFYYEMPNHILQAVLSRASNEIWRAGTRAAAWQFSESALRVPLLLSGLATLAGLACLLRLVGLPGAGVLAAWLLAVHPWFLRYASEARSYTLVMALIPAALIFLLKALATGRARWWVLFGVAQVALLHAYIASAFIVLVLNAMVPLVLWSQRRNGLDSGTELRRWVACSIFSASAFLVLFAPCLPQFLAYLQSEKALGEGGQEMGIAWTANLLSHLLAGIPWTTGGAPLKLHFELLTEAIATPATVALVSLLAVALGAIGTRHLFARGVLSGAVATVLLVPALLMYLEARSSGKFLFEWYLIFFLPGVCAVVAAGWFDLAPKSAALWWRIIVGLGAVGLAGGFFLWTAPQRDALMAHSIQPYREAVLLTRPSLDPNAEGQTAIDTAFFHAGPLVYDPRIVPVRSLDELKTLARRAESKDRELFLNIAFPVTAKSAAPDLYDFVENSGWFEEVATVKGINAEMDMWVLRYRPGKADAAGSAEPL
jgi:hypothetical protein